MSVFLSLLSAVYSAAAMFLGLYSASQVILLVLYLRYRHEAIPLPDISPEDLPKVAVQLPLYNEKFVVEQLLKAVAKLHYPRHRLTIQVLDDSTDDTADLVRHQVMRLRRKGLDIQHIRRANRTGYKAGALAYGMTQTDADFFAVFDADFVPPPDFLQRTIPYFVTTPTLGIVQTRWGHTNATANWLTQAQSLAIDAHFVVEQTARNRAGLLLTFNGTGGVWRRQCIEDAGGWSADTLTEDLDLSYRAQIRGWKYLYLPDIVVPGEIPPLMNAYKKQQARWAQGTNQCLVKLLPMVWRSRLTLGQKLMATQHLIQYLPHVFVLILLLLTPLMMLSGQIHHLPLESLGVVGLLPPLMHFVAQRKLYPAPRRWAARLLFFPVLMVIGTGIMLNNVWAAFKAFKSVLTRQHTEFVRTPKYGKQHSGYTLSRDGDRLVYVELVALVYAVFGLTIAVAQYPGLIPYTGLYVVAFLAIMLWGMWDERRLQAADATSAGGAATPVMLSPTVLIPIVFDPESGIVDDGLPNTMPALEEADLYEADTAVV